MQRYPFQPDILDALPEESVDLFRALEDVLLDAICRRLKVSGKLNEVTLQDIRALRAHGIPLTGIEKAILETTGISGRKLTQLFDDVVELNQRYFTSLINAAQLTQPETLVDAVTIDAIKRQTLGTLQNLTASAAFVVDAGRTVLPPADAFRWALDNAALQVQSGAVSYTRAIAGAVRQLAESGLKVVDYESGKQDQIGVAARRAIMTGVNQICAKYVERSADYLGTPYFEVSAHAGARDKPGPSQWSSHKAWQGRVYSTRSGDIYPSIYEVCGLGAVDGLEGVNCRHRRFPWVEGVSERTYTDEQLARIDDGLGCTFDGRTYTAYAATQMQRRIERTVRKLQREKRAYSAAGLEEDATTVGIRIRRLSAKYRAFSEAAGLPEQSERARVLYTDALSSNAATGLKRQRAAEAPIREAIRGGKYSLEINPDKQARHMKGTATPGRSVITVPLGELQKIINAQAGNGKINLTKDFSAWKHAEIISAGREIGFTINRDGAIVKAHSLKLHYSKTGVHAVPFSGRWKK